MGDFLHFVSGLTKESPGGITHDDWVAVYKGAVYHAHALSPESLGKLIAVFARDSNKSARQTKALTRLVEQVTDSEWKDFSGRDVASVLNGLVRLSHVPRDLFTAAAEYMKTLPLTEYVSEKDLGVLCNAFARAGLRDEALFGALTVRIESQLSSLSSQSCGNICHAFGKLGLNGATAESLLPKICDRVVTLKHASPQELSNVLYSLGNLGIRPVESLELLLDRIGAKVHRFNAVEIAAVSTALTKLGISDTTLMSKIRKNVETNFSNFSAYEFTAVLHAFSQLDVPVPKRLFTEIAPKVLLVEMNSHTACIAFCAFARVDITPSNELLLTLTRLIESENDGKYLVDVLFAISRFGKDVICAAELMHAVSRKLESRFPTDSASSINKAIFSFHKLGISAACRDLYSIVIQAAVDAPAHLFDGRQVSNMLYALANKDGPALDTNEHTLAKRLIRDVASSEMSPQLFGSCIESVSRLGLASSHHWARLERRLAVTIPESGIVDVKTVQALAHAGRLTPELAQLLIKRIDVSRLSLESGLALLHAVAYAKVTVCGLRSVVKLCLSKVESMNTEQLAILCKLARLTGATSWILDLNTLRGSEPLESPLTVELTRASDGTEPTGLAQISVMINDAISQYPGDKACFTIEALERSQDEGAPGVILELLIERFLQLTTGEDQHVELRLRALSLLAARRDTRVGDIAISMLQEYRGTKGLVFAIGLLDIDSSELRRFIINDFAPEWAPRSSKDDLTRFVSALCEKR